MAEPDAERRFDEHLRRIGMAKSYRNDPYFRATASMLRAWLGQVEMAMRQQEIAPEVITRVLNQLIFGAVSPGEVYRVDLDESLHAERLEQVEHWPLGTPEAPHKLPDH